MIELEPTLAGTLRCAEHQANSACIQESEVRPCTEKKGQAQGIAGRRFNAAATSLTVTAIWPNGRKIGVSVHDEITSLA